jgi:pimeloyl-ACP methyl ester carboxylesterase
VSTFALIHGAWHGSWCFDRLVPELAARGHESITMDLPVDDGSATFETYRDAVLDSMSGATGDAILVGHSLGAMAMPLVATERRVRATVFLCGIVPKFGGMPWDDGGEMEEPGLYENLIHHEDGSTSWPDIASATRAYFFDCRPEDAAWAFPKLRHQNSSSLWDRPYPLSEWPDCARASIACTDDVAVKIGWSRNVARTRLGIDAIEIRGSHSPFLSRPGVLADILSELASTL